MTATACAADIKLVAVPAAAAATVPACHTPNWSKMESGISRCHLSGLWIHNAEAKSTEVIFVSGELVAANNLLSTDNNTGFGAPGWWLEPGSAGDPVQLWWGARQRWSIVGAGL
jgi:hypothetical protein